MISAVVAVETAIIAMFFLNNRVTFDTAKTGIRQGADGIIRSNLVRSVGAVINIGLLYALTEFAGIYYLVSNIIAITAASVVNFIGEKKFNWKE
jgi:dolichol-phosphate mannosyltransferase